jgi:prephenate dehydrogenase
MNADNRSLPLIDQDAGRRPLVFERIGIVGLGLMGGSLALAARKTWPTALVIGVDRKDVLESAVVLHAIDVGAQDLDIIGEADLVVLAAPVEENMRLLPHLSYYLEKPVVVTDVSSTKRAIVEAARALPPHITFVGGHPVAGSARSGIRAARAEIFDGRRWLFTPDPEAEGESARAALERLERFVEALGAVPGTIDAAGHDRVMALVSHLPQLVASAIMEVVGIAAGEEGLSLSGTGLGDTTRLASSDATMWAGICRTNTGEIREAMTLLIDRLSELRERLDEPGKVEQLFAAASGWRRLLDEKTGKATRE